MRKTIGIMVLLLAVLLTGLTPSVAGNARAASHQQSHPAFLDKTRFALHMGIAYYAFHHFVWARYKSGQFKSGAPHRTATIIKAAIAVLVTVHELKKAYDIAAARRCRLW